MIYPAEIIEFVSKCKTAKEAIRVMNACLIHNIRQTYKSGRISKRMADKAIKNIRDGR